MLDLGQSIAQSLAKDGRTVMTGALKMGGFPVTGAGPGTASDHLVTRGQVLDLIAGGDGGGSGGTGGGGDASLADFRSTDDTDDLQAIYRAYRLGHRRIRAVAGTGLGARLGAAHAGKFIATGLPFTTLKPGGDPTDPRDYNTSRGNLCLPMDGMPGAGEPMHGLELYGDGMGRTVWKQVDNFAFNVNVQSANAADNIRSVLFRDFSIEGLGDETATQTGHIFAIAGASNMTWERVEFLGFNADAICLWPSPNPDEVTHNYSITVRDCRFDGVNSQNRQPISIEDGVFVLIENSYFYRCCTDSDSVSVAAIDVEPRDKPTYQVGFLTVQNNLFEDVNRGGVALYLNGPDIYTFKPRGFTIRGNRFIRCKRLFDFAGGFTSELASAVSRHAVEVTGNYAEDCGDIRISGMYGVQIHHNQFLRIGLTKFGEPTIDKANRNVLIDDNIFTRSKNVSVAIHDATSIDCSFSRNRMYDCGIQDTTTGAGYVFIARDGQVGVAVEGNRVANPNGRLKAGYLITDTATYGTSSIKRDNLLTGTAFTIDDTFDPQLPFQGVIQNVTGVTVQPLTVYTFDVAFPNAVVGRPYEAWFVGFTGVSTEAIRHNFCLFAYCRETNVVRVTIYNNVNSNNTGELGNCKLYIREKK